MNNQPKIFYIDLFSGAGGTTTGIHRAGSEVVACVNHDEKAIASHEVNHPNCIHFIEDVRDHKVIKKIAAIVADLRKRYPDCIIILWASLECTNYSKAKGGQPRNADSRTLAYTLYNYIDELQPDLVQIENVREFMSWGPLDENGRPISRKNGIHYQSWVKTIERMGYEYDHKLLNAANYDAYTSRERFFGQFSKRVKMTSCPDHIFQRWTSWYYPEGIPIKWPKPTNAKKVEKGGLFVNDLKPWNAVGEILDLEDEGESIFDRVERGKKVLVDPTLLRIDAGLDKFVEDKFLTSYYGNGGAHSIKEPCPTVTTKDRFTVVQPQFLDNQYGKGFATSINVPNGTLTANPKQRLISVNWLLNPQFKDKGRSLDRPCFTLIAKMDKRPPSLMTAVFGMEKVQIKEGDSEVMKNLKLRCQKLGISDIKMRMLKIPELLQIQGFPADYQLIGTQADQKKFIGNAVEVNMAKAIAKTTRETILEYLENTLQTNCSMHNL